MHQEQHTAGAAAVLQAPVWCFRFYDAPDCRSFKSALQALLSSMHSRTLQQQQQRQQQVEAAANTGPGTGAPQVIMAQHTSCCCLATGSQSQHAMPMRSIITFQEQLPMCGPINSIGRMHLPYGVCWVHHTSTLYHMLLCRSLLGLVCQMPQQQQQQTQQWLLAAAVARLDVQQLQQLVRPVLVRHLLLM
jgi:hypothetical protein